MNLNRRLQTIYRVLMCLLLALPMLVQAADETTLFEEALVFSPPDATSHVLRSRSVIVTDTLLTGVNTLQQRSASPDANTAPVAKSLTLNLFDDLVVSAKLTNAYQNRSGSRTWVGEIDTTVKGTAAFVVRNGEIHGVIDIPGEGNFSIRPGDHNAHIIEEIDNSAMLTGESDAVIEAPVSTNTNGNDSSASDNTDSGTEGATVAISNDDGSIIDVYVAYDQDAAGGSVTSGTAQSLAELFIAYTNQAYENSSISQRVWLVGDVDGYDYTSGTDDGNPVTNTAEKNDLGNVKNGSITGLHDKRNEYHADLVLFFRPFTSGTCSGLAYLQTANDDVNWESSGFSVMQACNFGNTVFAHELGHNMGAMHDWYVDTRVAPATYAHGYIDITNKFRTIMAYGNRCDSLSISCGRVAHFSNPAVNYNGNATGVAGGTSVACASGNNAPGAECDADNARNFNEKALITSQFRESKVVWTGAVDTDWNNANNWASNRGKPSATTIANHVPRAYDNVLIPAGVGNIPTIAGNAVARELTIASGATLNMTGGTLTVGWAWEDAGGFNASAGTVKLAGPLGITLTSSSAFNHLEIGTGADTSEVMLDSDLNVDGNFTIKDGAKFKAGSHQINLAGNYSVSQSGFNKGSSQVVFDGTSQSVNKTTIATLLDEGFAAADNTSCCGSTGLPAGWASEKDTSNGILFADLGDGNGGVAYSWSSSSNTWIITKAFSLLPGVDYTFEFDARRRYADGTIIQSISAHYGLAQSSASMTNAIGSSLADGDVTTAFTTKQGAFTVPTAGNYYIGINIKSTGVRTLLDNLVLKGSSALQFHDLQVSSGETTFLQALEVSNDLQVDAIANFGTHDVSVEGIVTNNGELKQTKSVPAGLNTSFIAIKNKTATTDKYFGVEVNPTTALGNTIVSIKGNQTCTAATGFVLRCYGVNPTTSGAATIKFYYRAAELNANSTPVIKTFSSGVWSVAPGVVARGGSADGSWVSSANLTASGTFGLDDATTIDTDPIAFTLVDQPNVPLSNVRTSSPITVSGINAPANISVSTGGSYDIDGSGNFISTASTVTNTQTVRVRHTSSATPGTSVNTTLTIGPKSDTFTSTTVGPDTDPVAFNFVDQTGVALGSTRTSAAITISGINVPATISVSGGSYQINGTGAFISTPSTITDGQTVRVQHTASANTATTVDTTLTVGTVSDIFTSTTATAAAITPDAFTFPSPRNVIVLSGSAVQSNAITISGLSAVAGIIVQDGEYSINGGAFIAQVGTVQNGDVIRVRHVASGAIGGVTTTTLTIGTATTTFSSTTTDQGIIGIEASTDGGGGSIAWLDLLLVLLLMLTLGATRTFHNRGQ